MRKIHFPKFKQTSLTSESEVSVCFERGGKIAASHDRGLTDIRNGSAEVTFNETLSLVVTMYKDSNDKYQVHSMNISFMKLMSPSTAYIPYRIKVGNSSYDRNVAALWVPIIRALA